MKHGGDDPARTTDAPGAESGAAPQSDYDALPQADPLAVVAELPANVWRVIIAVMRATNESLSRREPTHIPRQLRPFLGWYPERLDRPVVRRAIIDAVLSDARYRGAMAEQLSASHPDLAQEVSGADVSRLQETHEREWVGAALLVNARWDDLARASLSDEGAGDGQAGQAGKDGRAGNVSKRSDDSSGEEEAEKGDGVRRAQALRITDLERSHERANARLKEVSLALEATNQRLELAERARTEALQELNEAKSRHRARLARLRRQAADARSSAERSDRRVQTLADELSGLLARLTGNSWEDVAADAADSAPPPAPAGTPHLEVTPGSTPVVPRRTPPARSGRPCVLPPGVAPESTVAVEALLQVGGLELMLDGYNVTKDLRGRAKMSLHDQRLWLLRTVAGATAMYDVRPTIVFDAQAGVGGLAPSARGVRTVFTATNELADDRIKEYVRALPATTAVLVVTGDREIRDDVRAHHGDVVSSGVFLRAIGASC